VRKEVANMLHRVRAFVFLMKTALECSGVDLTLADSPTPPQGGTLVGTTDVVQVGTAVLTFTRGAGPAKRTFWTGYWTASGN
jgi:hypothetical protein